MKLRGCCVSLRCAHHHKVNQTWKTCQRALSLVEFECALLG